MWLLENNTAGMRTQSISSKKDSLCLARLGARILAATSRSRTTQNNLNHSRDREVADSKAVAVRGCEDGRSMRRPYSVSS